MSFNTLVIAIPVLVAIVILLLFGWRREMAKRKEKADRIERIKTARIPEGAAYVTQAGTVKKIRDELIGSYMLVAVGTFGTNLVRFLLILMHRCGLERLIGSILVIENDSQMRVRFHESVPEVYHDRIVYAYTDAFTGGMRNRPIPWVLEHVALWGVPICKATREAIELHLRRNSSRSPAGILFFVSLGGQVPLGIPAAEILFKRFPETLFLALTALPRHRRLRDRFAVIKAAYEQNGIHGWVLSDNLGSDPVTCDYGMVAMITGLADAALHADQGTQPNNAFALALTQEAGGILIFQTFASDVVGYAFAPDPAIPTRYFVIQQDVTEQILKGLHRIAQGLGAWSADLPTGAEGTSTFDIVMTAVNSRDLQAIEDDVKAGLKLRLQSYGLNGQNPDPTVWYGKPNYELPFASIATVVDPARPVCPMVIVRLTAVREGAAVVDEIVQSPEDRLLSQAPAALLAPAKSEGPGPELVSIGGYR